MSSKAGKRILVGGGVLALIGVLFLLEQFSEFIPWVWAAILAGAGLGAFGLYLTDRSDGLVLFAAYLLCATSGLIALVPSGILHGQDVALYVLPAIALPFLVISARGRAWWWALIPAYILLAITGVIGLTRLRILDNLISIYVLSAVTTPFFVIYSWNGKQWWALIPGGITAVIGMSFLIARGTVGSTAALALLVITASILVRAFVSRDLAGRAAPPRSDEPAPSEP